MTKFQLNRPDGPWDYPTLGFRAAASAILDGTLFDPEIENPPDSWWSVYGGGAAQTGITLININGRAPVPALPTDGSLPIYRRSTGGYQNLTPTEWFADPEISGPLSASIEAAIPPNPLFGARVFSIGDSITANGTYYGGQYPAGGATGVTQWMYSLSQNWLLLAVMLSEGKLIYSGTSATSGFTSTQIMATHLPVALASDADYVFELAGINDASNGVTFATTKANLISFVEQTLAAKKTPVLCAVMPYNTLGSAQIQTRINALKAQLAKTYSVPFIDLWSAVVDQTGATSDWDVGLSQDGLHPLSQGAQRMAQKIDSDFTQRLSLMPTPGLSWNGADTTLAGLVAAGNNMFLTDSNADGVPDEWVKTQGTGPTLTYVTDAKVRGKMYKIVAGSDEVKIVRSAGGDVTAGHRFRWSVWVRSDIATPNAGNAILRIKTADNNVTVAGVIFDIDVPTGRYVTEFVMPTGLANYSLQIEASCALTGDTLWVGETMLIDLDAQNLIV